MTPAITLFFSFLFLPLAYCAPPPATPMTNCTSLDGGHTHTQFVRSRCNLTHYPDLCFASLSSYATAVRGSLPELARVAANVTLSRIRAFRAHVSALRRTGAALGRAEAALRDCVEQLGDAADQVYRTSNELRGVEALVRTEVTWRVSNAQTWMSAALTNEESCSDGFHEVAAASSDASGGGGSGIDVKTDICRRVVRVKQYTSNALALVNSLVDGRR